MDDFLLEYFCPYKVVCDKQLGMELEQAIEHVDIMEKEGRVEYMMASTHSHLFGSALILATLPSRLDTPPFDALVLRYSMPHKIAAEYILLSKL